MLVGWLCLTSLRQRGHLETASIFTVPCEGRGNQTPGRRVAVHYTTAAPCQLLPNCMIFNIINLS